MLQYLPLSFVQQKIAELENALFFSISDALLKIPTCVVKIDQVDELGQLWFAIPKPAQFIYEFDRVFPAKLDFFKKGSPFFLKVVGKAFIVNDPEEINSVEFISGALKQRLRSGEMVLLKVKITQVDYAESTFAKPSPISLLKTFKTNVYKWFQQAGDQHALTFERIPVNNGLRSPNLYSN